MNPSSETTQTPSPIPLLDLKRQHATIAAEVATVLTRVVEAQAFILGPEVKAFEEETARYIGSSHAIGCASGSDALLLALMALNLSPGSEVITTPYTFFATVGSIVRLGLRPVFCDIDPRTFNLDPSKLSRLITPRTRVILPVHLFGQCAAMDPILALAEDHGLAVVEDAAQAIGARDKNGHGAGTRGAIGCFSFFPSKNLGAFGDGGLLATADLDLAQKLAALRCHGSTDRYFHEWSGINSRLDALHAAVLRVKLPHLDAWSDARAANAGRYRKLFAAADLLQTDGSPESGRVIPPLVLAGRHIFNQYVIRVHAALRDPLREHLAARKIGSAIYYPLPLHLQPCFRDLGYREGDLPEAERASKESLALPIFSELIPDEQERVVGEIQEFMKEQK